MSGITFPHLLIIAILVILIFGTKKLSSMGYDIGLCIKGFKKAMSDEDNTENLNQKIENLNVNKSKIKEHEDNVIKEHKEDLKK